MDVLSVQLGQYIIVAWPQFKIRLEMTGRSTVILKHLKQQQKGKYKH